MVALLSTEKLGHTFELKSHEKLSILNDISFDIRYREIVVIHGKSGSGKSTLLRCLGGMLKPTAGKVLYESKDLWAMSEQDLSDYRAREIGFVFQDYALIDELTVEQNIRLALDLLDLPFCKDRFDALIHSLELEERLAFYPVALSGGEKQRVSIARALIKEPKLILADEPTGNLDASMSREVMSSFKKVIEESDCSAIVVSHDQEWGRFANSSFYLKDGELIKGVVGG